MNLIVVVSGKGKTINVRSDILKQGGFFIYNRTCDLPTYKLIAKCK